MSEPMASDLTPPPPPAGGGRPGNPWDRRGELGLVAGFIDNVKLFVLSPGRAFDETREKGDFAGPLIYGIVLGWVCVAIGQVWNMLFGTSILSMMPAEYNEVLSPMLMGSSVGFVLQLLLAPLYIVIGLLIYTAILHVCLALVGGLTTSASGFEGTFRVVAFSMVAQLGNIVPFFGGIISFVWGVVLCVIGFTSLHRTTQGKALIAILIPFILCCICVVVGIAVFGASMAAFFASQQ